MGRAVSFHESYLNTNSSVPVHTTNNILESLTMSDCFKDINSLFSISGVCSNYILYSKDKEKKSISFIFVCRTFLSLS